MADKNCPFHKIDIPEDREIVLCDNLKFPWKQDLKGYFLVKIENDILCCGFVNNNHKMIVEFRGKNPDKIIKEIIKRKICNIENIGYIASELAIAHNCIKNKKKYVQR